MGSINETVMVFDPADPNDQGVIPQEWKYVSMPVPSPSWDSVKKTPPPVGIYVWHICHINEKCETIELGWTTQSEEGTIIIHFAPFPMINTENSGLWKRVEEIQ